MDSRFYDFLLNPKSFEPLALGGVECFGEFREEVGEPVPGVPKLPEESFLLLHLKADQ